MPNFASVVTSNVSPPNVVISNVPTSEYTIVSSPEETNIGGPNFSSGISSPSKIRTQPSQVDNKAKDIPVFNVKKIQVTVTSDERRARNSIFFPPVGKLKETLIYAVYYAIIIATFFKFLRHFHYCSPSRRLAATTSAVPRADTENSFTATHRYRAFGGQYCKRRGGGRA